MFVRLLCLSNGRSGVCFIYEPPTWWIQKAVATIFLKKIVILANVALVAKHMSVVIVFILPCVFVWWPVGCCSGTVARNQFSFCSPGRVDRGLNRRVLVSCILFFFVGTNNSIGIGTCLLLAFSLVLSMTTLFHIVFHSNYYFYHITTATSKLLLLLFLFLLLTLHMLIPNSSLFDRML